MKKYLWTLFALILLAGTSCQEKIDIEKEKEAIMAVIQEEGDAFAAMDMERLFAVHVQDSLDTRLGLGENSYTIWAGWDEISHRFGNNIYRNKMLDRLKIVITQLKIAGCKYIYLDGSFVTNKQFPNDYDICWDVTGVDDSTLFNNIPELFD